MANVIITIHGLGNKPSKQLLTHWWRLSMIEGLRASKYRAVLPKCEMVYWADILYDKPQSEDVKDVKSPCYMDEKYTRASKDFKAENHTIRKKIIYYLSKQLDRILLKDDLTLQYSFITDVILHKYFSDLEIYYSDDCSKNRAPSCRARELIRERLLAVLEKYKDDDIMLISHSMGTIVAFDVLTFLAPELKIHTFVTLGSPLGLPVVVSKIAAEQKQKHIGQNHMLTPHGICRNWYNFADILDKVAFSYKLSDRYAENSNGVKPVDFLVTNNYEMNGVPNPHKSYGYLRTPEFSKILNEFIRSENVKPMQKVARRTAQIISSVVTRIQINKERRNNQKIDDEKSD